MIALALWAAPALAGTCGGLPASGPVPNGSYTFPPNCVHTLTGTLSLSGGVSIDGAGGRIEGDGTFRLIDVLADDFTIMNVTLYRGGGTNASALYMQSGGTLAIYRVAFYDNDSIGGGGALRLYAAAAIITDSWFENNDSDTWGGAIWATSVASTFQMSGCVLKNNTSGDNKGQYSSGGYNTGMAYLNGNYWNSGSAPTQPADIYLAANAIPTAPITSWLSTEPVNVMHPYLGNPDPDTDGDGIPDSLDLCFGVNASGDTDGDGICDSDDPCVVGDLDADGVCDDVDACFGANTSGDADGDGICDSNDPCTLGDLDADGVCDDVDKCFGDNASGDSDKDKVCNSDDACLGDDSTGDVDGDGLCEDRDKCFGTDIRGDVDLDGICGDLDVCRGDDALGDTDADAVCDDLDLCEGDDATRDLDGDGVCGDKDACAGDDLLGDADADGSCDDRDLCAGDDATGDLDADGTCGDLDPCLGDDTFGDTDGDKVCEDRDWCDGDDASGNWDDDALCDDTDPPVALNADGPFEVPADAPTTIGVAEGVLANDVIVGGTLALTVSAEHGTVDLAQDGSFVYTPTDADYFGPDWFEYGWTDDDDALTASVTLYVGDAPSAPIAALDDVYSVPLDDVLTVDAAGGVLANDVGPGLVVTLDEGPANGVLELAADGSFVYTPDTEEPSLERFTYTATDGTDTVRGRVTLLIEARATAIDPWADVDGRCRCAPTGGGGGAVATLFAAALAVVGRRRVRS